MEFLDDEDYSNLGSDAVISYLHHFFLRYGLGEEVVHLHCDNCAGQNKNRYMLFYLIWRTIHALHRSIELNFMVAGHTKFGPDWCFGLLKQKFRRTPVSCLDDMVRVTEQSTVTGINIAQLVGTENQDVKVPLYNWQTFLADSFRPLLGMKQFQHFRFSSEEPGVVFARKQPSDDEQRFDLQRRRGVHPPAALPAATPPPGLNVHRQWYLYDKIREFCHPNCVDVTCPEPTQPKPHQSAAATATAAATAAATATAAASATAGPSGKPAAASATARKRQKKK